MKRNINMRTRGFSLVEVMVSIFVLTLGIIGTAGMQTTALRTAQQSSHHGIAMELATEMAEEIRATALAHGEAHAFAGLDYRSAAAEPSPPAAQCMRPDADCSASALASFNIYSWEKRLSTALPSARLVVCHDGQPWNEGARAFVWNCHGDTGAPLVIKIGWQSKDGDGRLIRDASGEFPPDVVLTVANRES